MAVIPGVSDGELIRTTWGDAVADELNTNTVKLTGNHTLAGSINIMGLLTANNQIAISDSPPTAPSHAARKDYVDAADADKLSLTGGTLTGNLIVGALPNPDVPTAGVLLDKDGGLIVVTPASVAVTLPNAIFGRGGSPAGGTGGQFIRFDRGENGIGSITIASASSVAYNTTSDPRLKEQTGDVDDAADLVHELGAKAFRGRWIADQGQGEEWVFLRSTDIEQVAPFAVTGEADATNPQGEIVPQQANYPSLVPLLFAALSQALDRIAALEAAAT